MIPNTWISPPVLSFIPISVGWYTTDLHKQRIQAHPDECKFKVNKIYAVKSSSISFWIPCTIMIFTYLTIFREANRQEKQLALRQDNAMLMHRHSNGSGTNGKENNSFFCPYALSLVITIIFLFRRSIKWVGFVVNTKRSRSGSKYANKR